MKLINFEMFDASYYFCTEEVPYVRCATVLLDEVRHGGGLPNES